MLKFAGRVSGNGIGCGAIFAGGEKVGVNLPAVTIATTVGAIGVVSVRFASRLTPESRDVVWSESLFSADCLALPWRSAGGIDRTRAVTITNGDCRSSCGQSLSG